MTKLKHSFRTFGAKLSHMMQTWRNRLKATDENDPITQRNRYFN